MPKLDTTTRRRRVLHVVLSLTPGGAERIVIEMCQRLRPAFDVAVCCLDSEGVWAATLRDRGIEVMALERRPGFRPELGRRIADIAKARGIELLHCHQYSPFVYGRLAKYWRPELRLVYTEQGRLSDAPPSRKRRLINPIVSRFDGAIIAVSDDLRRYMFDAGFPRGRVGVIYNGVEPGSCPSPADRQRARRLLGLDEDTFLVGTVARLDPVKDLHTLLNAFALAHRELCGRSRLIVIGDGPERRSLVDRAARADLAGAVDFLGVRSDITAILPALDIYVNSSISEGSSLTILEAMAAGVPVVATAAGGTPEVLDGQAGVLVPVRDPVRLAGAIRALASDDPRRAALGAAGRRRLEASFTIDHMVGKYAELYQCLLN